MRLAKAGQKRWYPKHNTQSTASAARQVRAVEKTERQAAKKEIREAAHDDVSTGVPIREAGQPVRD